MTPKDELELAEAIRSTKDSIRILGSGSRKDLGNPVKAHQTLYTQKLEGIEIYEPGALTLVAKAGTSLAEIEALLETEGQHLPFEPMDHSQLFGSQTIPTIGGVVACNISGPRRIQGVACRDSLIGVRFVDGLGNIVKNGGRVMKNVTGYDLVKLLAGSYGTLGVISEVAFKLLPKPESCSVLLINNLDDATAQKAMASALGSPYDVSGAVHLPKGIDGHPVTMLRLEGFEKSVKYRSEQLRSALKDYGDIEIESDPKRTKSGWSWVKNLHAISDEGGDVWQVSVKPTKGPEFVADLKKHHDVLVQYDWGGGLIWVNAPEGTNVRLFIKEGYANLVRSSAETKFKFGAFHPQSETIEMLSSALRKKFDPKGILNSGIMGK